MDLCDSNDHNESDDLNSSTQSQVTATSPIKPSRKKIFKRGFLEKLAQQSVQIEIDTSYLPTGESIASHTENLPKPCPSYPVQHFTTPQKITINPSGSWKATPSSEAKRKNVIRHSHTSNSSQVSELCHNGGVLPGFYYWSQNRYEIQCSIVIPNSIRGRDVQIRLEEKRCQVLLSSTSFEMEVSLYHPEGTTIWLPIANFVEPHPIPSEHATTKSSKDGKMLLAEFEFPYSVLTDEETWIWELKSRTIDWEALLKKAKHEYQQTPYADSSIWISHLNSLPSSLLDISLTKKCELQEAIIWWPCLMKGGPVVQVTTFSERKLIEKSDSASTSPHSNVTTAFKQNYEKALQLFKEKRKGLEENQSITPA